MPCPCENCPFGYDVSSDLDQAKGTEDGTTWGQGKSRRIGKKKKKKRLGENMGAINTHLSRKTEA